jgi:gluconolactonase
VEKLIGGDRFLEGPAWNVPGGFLVFSDIPADRMYRFDPATGTASVYREPSHNANGNFYDAGGALYTCEHGSRSVSRTAPDGVVTTLADRFEGHRFNSPNDVVVKSDGTVWFTDPTYGLGKAPKEMAGNYVFCLDQNTGALRPVATDFDQPNGLCFSPDERRLYIADSGKPRYVRAFDVTADNRLENGRVFCQIDKGVPDGMRCDKAGNLFSTSEDSVQIFAPDGTRLGKIPVPEVPSNIVFGGKDGDELYITARTSLYRVKVTAKGALR